LKSVAITGFAAASRDLVYNEPPESEIWCLGGAFHWLKFQPDRKYRWFEIHEMEYLVNERDQQLLKANLETVEWLKTADMPVYMVEHYDEIPNSIEYPLRDVTDNFGIEYFTSSPAFMFALAMHEGFERISVPGIDLSSGSEYFFERPCFEYWVGRAHQAGIEVVVPDESSILKGVTYGRWSRSDHQLMEMARVRGERAAQTAMGTWNALVEALGHFREIDTLMAMSAKNSPGHQAVVNRRNGWLNKVNALESDLQNHMGALRDAQHWATTLNVLTPQMMVPDLTIPEVSGKAKDEPEREPEAIGAAD
jgi:hypothetical protein